MKQIVFLVSAFVVLFQLHSTTAISDSQTGWDIIEFNVRLNTDTMKDWVKKLGEAGESALKEANVQALAKWVKFIDQYLQQMDGVKTEFSELIGELRKTVSVEWKEVKPKIYELVVGVFFKLREIAQKVVDAAGLGTQQEINDSVDGAMDDLTSLMETAPADTKNILIETAQEKLNAEQTAGGQESSKNE